jgi:hypothetical protein
MEEALKRLRAAEENNQLLLQQLQQKLADYEKAKQAELRQLVFEQKASYAKEQATLERSLQQRLQEATEEIAAESQAASDRFQENLLHHQEQIVDQIVEGVIQAYGSHEIK